MSDSQNFDAARMNVSSRATQAPAFGRSAPAQETVFDRPAKDVRPSVVTDIRSGAAARPEQDDKAVTAGQPPTESVANAVTKLNDYVQSVQRDLEFSFDDELGRSVITVIDRNTQEVVRQLPDDLALELARKLQNDEPLHLFDARI